MVVVVGYLDAVFMKTYYEACNFIIVHHVIAVDKVHGGAQLCGETQWLDVVALVEEGDGARPRQQLQYLQIQYKECNHGNVVMPHHHLYFLCFFPRNRERERERERLTTTGLEKSARFLAVYGFLRVWTNRWKQFILIFMDWLESPCHPPSTVVRSLGDIMQGIFGMSHGSEQSGKIGKQIYFFCVHDFSGRLVLAVDV